MIFYVEGCQPVKVDTFFFLKSYKYIAKQTITEKTVGKIKKADRIFVNVNNSLQLCCVNKTQQIINFKINGL